VFKNDSQLWNIIELAKAYNYEQMQVIATTLQTHIDIEQENQIMSKNAHIRNIIKSMEFIGANNEDNNKLAEKLQGLIQQPMLMVGYVSNGYVESNYVK